MDANMLLEVIERVNSEIHVGDSLNLCDYSLELFNHISNSNLGVKGLERVPLCIFDNDFVGRFDYHFYLDFLKGESIKLFKPFYDNMKIVDEYLRDDYLEKMAIFISSLGGYR